MAGGGWLDPIAALPDGPNANTGVMPFSTTVVGNQPASAGPALNPTQQQATNKQTTILAITDVLSQLSPLPHAHKRGAWLGHS
jgi:hypothetical protein